jgi:hypothetical protein
MSQCRRTIVAALSHCKIILNIIIGDFVSPKRRDGAGNRDSGQSRLELLKDLFIPEARVFLRLKSKGVVMNIVKKSAPLFDIIMVSVQAAIFMVSDSSASTFQPQFRPSVEIMRTAAAIRIDGVLDDPGWMNAPQIDNFVEISPGDNLEPPVKTRVMATYDDNYLYVAFACLDDPKAARATMCQRDQYNGDDQVAVFIDTYGDASWAYKFMVNPYGIQKDLMWTSVVGDDAGYDLIWNSAARITETGYDVEIAIPFSSIRFPGGETQEWKIDFLRSQPRESERWFSWAAFDRNEQCDPCQWGVLTGIKNVSAGRGVEILPSIIASQAGRVGNLYDKDALFNNEDIDGELSLGGKCAINSDIALEATANPDFSQIEADAAQIDVNTPVALLYPERRPFFQEGRDIFRTLFNSFNTRAINDPQCAAKLVGRSGPYRFGVVSAVDENSYYLIPLEESNVEPFNVGKSYVNIFRAMRSLGGGSQIGLLYNDCRYESGGYNSILAFDQLIRLSNLYVIDGQYIMTMTKEADDSSIFYNPSTFDDNHTIGFDGESFNGYGLITRFRRNSRHWNFLINYDQVGPSYRTETGYDPWMNYQNGVVWSGYSVQFDRGLFRELTPQVYAETRWNFAGLRKWTHYRIGFDGHTRYAQAYVGLYFNAGDERWEGKHFQGLYSIHFDGGINPSNQFGLSAYIERGVGAALNALEKGNETSIGLNAEYKPIDRLTIEPSFNYLRSDHVENGDQLFENYVFRTRLNLQVSQALSMRLVVQRRFLDMLVPIRDGEKIANYVSRRWDIDPLITFRLSPFSVFHVGAAYDYDKLPYDPYPFYSREPDPNYSSAWDLRSRQFFMKLQYLFQI